ncbi:hypothetical protein Pint_33662 [Pistacia integerrima]|uniref:Uncharacterized protein n=1 Tax=Pistacia integerrima TaxID=434235 RepID=A0ACC0X6L4_9ROSI|nr:hypothetical protein Pint_33662 [Pistacia integerrima]
MENHEGYFHEASFTDPEGNPRTSKVPVVQELARQGLNHLPKRFIRANNTQHPSVKDVVKGFFGLSFEDKKRSVGSYASIDNMGYGRNFVKSEDEPLDWIDRLTMKAAPVGGDEGLNVWPQNPPNFKAVIEKYVKQARNVMDELLEALAEAFSLERNAFLKYFNPENSEMNVRVNYYPPCPRPDLTLGLTPHTDGSVLTLLIQFEASGSLQILKDKQWLTLLWPSHTLLVNVGDLLEIMSNGRLKSPWHRVVTQMDVERFSVALFYNPPSRVEIEPEPKPNQDDDAMEEDGFEKVVVGDYLQHFYRVSPTDEKKAIIYAKAK